VLGSMDSVAAVPHRVRVLFLAPSSGPSCGFTSIAVNRRLSTRGVCDGNTGFCASSRGKEMSLALQRRGTVLEMKKKRASSSSSRTSGGASRGFGRVAVPQFNYTGSIRPGVQSPRRVVPDSITLPSYAKDGRPKPPLLGPKFPWDVRARSEAEIAAMRIAGRVAREVLDAGGRAIQPGVTTDEVDAVVHEETIKKGGYPSPLNYHGFPKSCCTSVNEVVCHGIPDSTVLSKGDIVNLDVTVYINGVHGDMSEMFIVGGADSIDERGRELVKCTYECLHLAIDQVQVGRPYSELGAFIEKHASEHGFSTVKNFCGHGIGSEFHTTPNVLHYKNDEPNGTMAVGHTFTIEPMICEGIAENVLWPDKWTATTLDGKRSAQFEHTLLITDSGVEILTARIPGESQTFWWES